MNRWTVSQMPTQLSAYSMTQKLMINVMKRISQISLIQNKTHVNGAFNWLLKNTPSVTSTHMGIEHSEFIRN